MWTRRGVVALLLAVAVLACHGLYGASHQVDVFGPEAPGQVVAHGAPHHHGADSEHAALGGDQGEGHAGHPDGMAYAASLSAALGAARGPIPAPPSADPGRRYPPPFLRPARGSPLAVLQVFRL